MRCHLIAAAVLLLTKQGFAAEPSRILFVGDSHSVGAFGHQLHKNLNSLGGAVVKTVASCSSRPSYWMDASWKTQCGYWEPPAEPTKSGSNDKMTPLLSSFKPTTVVIALGANMLGDLTKEKAFERARPKLIGELEKMAQLARQGAQANSATGICFWITPPTSKYFSKASQDRFVELALKAVSPYCTVIDSRPLSRALERPDGREDGWGSQLDQGLHYDQGGKKGKALARDWADGVFRQMQVPDLDLINKVSPMIDRRECR